MSKSIKNQVFGLLGLLGGVFFMAGDCLLYVYPKRDTALNVDPVFSEMPVWRFTVSALLGVIGMGCMLFGTQSLYAMTKNVCGKKMQALAVIGIIGASGTALAHFNLGSLLPLAYKSILNNGGSHELAEKACSMLAGWVTPLDILLIVMLYVQFVVLSYMILSGRANISRWYFFMGPVGAVTLGVVWKTIFNGSVISGAWGSCESLGEGLMYLTTMIYWKKQIQMTSDNCTLQKPKSE